MSRTEAHVATHNHGVIRVDIAPLSAAQMSAKLDSNPLAGVEGMQRSNQNNTDQDNRPVRIERDQMTGVIWYEVTA